MNVTKKLRLFFSHGWQPLLGVTLGVLIVSFLLFYRLGTLVPGFSEKEIVSREAARSLHVILENPLFLPYKLIQYVLLTLHHQDPLAMRSVSALFGALAVLFLYYVLRRWYTFRIAVMGTFLFVSSSIFLVYARTATPTIMYTLLLASLAYGTWVRRTKKHGFALIIGVIIAATLIYTPGLLWFAIIAAIWQKGALKKQISSNKKSLPLAVILFVVLLSPLILAVYNHPALIKPLVGLPAINYYSIITYGKNLGSVVNQLLLHGPTDAMFGLVGVALLDVFIAVMAVLGIYAYIFRRRLDRAKMIIGALILGVILIALSGPVSILLLVPFIYILAASGIAFMLQQWFTVFPRNPLARGIGLGLIICAVLVTSYYHINRYFVAWPHAAKTKQAFYLRPPV